METRAFGAQRNGRLRTTGSDREARALVWKTGKEDRTIDRRLLRHPSVRRPGARSAGPPYSYSEGPLAGAVFSGGLGFLGFEPRIV